MSKGLTIVLSILGVVVAGIILIVVMAVSSQNKAINLEEQILASESSIKVQEKRRVDLIHNLVDTVEQYAKYEGATLQKVTEARTQASLGNVEEATTAINAVTEAYPDLKANENYKTLMLELSTTENLIAEQRNNFNTQVRAYNKHVRSFPNSMFLSILGYEKINKDYLDFNAPTDAPQDLFSKDAE